MIFIYSLNICAINDAAIAANFSKYVSNAAVFSSSMLHAKACILLSRAFILFYVYFLHSTTTTPSCLLLGAVVGGKKEQENPARLKLYLFCAARGLLGIRFQDE